VLPVMLLYANVGGPAFNRHATAASDDVNPLNRFIWLGLMGVCGRKWVTSAA
jgi:hypothetical protein